VYETTENKMTSVTTHFKSTSSSRKADTLNILTTHLRCGIFSDSITTNFLVILTTKKVRTMVNTWRN